jgi:ATP-dependent helicase HrpB
MLPHLPIDDVIPDVLAAVRTHGRAVLQAPPGAGKTTRVPLALMPHITGRILMLEPRRLAARSAAEHMASLLGEDAGQRIGYRMRGASVTSKATRVEVVTEGILTRMLHSDPSLDGIGAVIFDEFHERSLNADLGLALVWEVREALRPDLVVLVMSATLDAGPVAALLNDAPMITASGRAFAVETRWLDRAPPKGQRFEHLAADLIATAVAAETEGGVLVFLPGEGEIRRTASALAQRLPANCHLHMLFGAMPFKDQRAAIAPATAGRKIVLATSIAETSLTIEDVRVVVDCGRARRARFDPGSGMSRLVTDHVTRAEATQRQGRAGRVAPGVCYRMWTRGEDGGMAPFPPAEIEAADLAGLALDLALWGSNGNDLAFLTAPPPAALTEARALLANLGALGMDGRITAHGRKMTALPLHPRLAHMLLLGGPDAASVAALLAERDPLRGAPADLSLRLEAVLNPSRFAKERPYTVDRNTVERIRTEEKRLRALTPRSNVRLSVAELTALAYPDRIAQRRPGEAPRYLLSGGKGAVLDLADPMAQTRYLIATDLDGDQREARIRTAIPISDAALRALFADDIAPRNITEWSKRDRRIIARQQLMLGALVLEDRPWADAPLEAMARAACDGLRDIGLPMSAAAARFCARAMLLRDQGVSMQDMSLTGLLETVEDWLLPYLTKVRSADDLRKLDLLAPLQARLSWDEIQSLDRFAPAHFVTPLGRKVPIDYAGEAPSIALRLQELFGANTHPTVGPKRLPLRITLLSPGQHPVQVTMDLPGFWAASYADVRKDMRGQYPRHPWPEDPTQADPTTRAKPRGT